MLDIACIILTKDEEIHLERCIRSAQRVCRDVWVVDSYSTDQTCAIAARMGAHVVQHPFTYQAAQFNWAIDHLPITNAWIWRLDADEFITEPLAAMAERELPLLPDGVNGVYVNRQIVFMNRPLRHGGWYPAPQIKLVRRGFGRSEDKLMDEHLVVTSGTTVRWDADQTDWGLRPLDWWWHKQEGYARREALNIRRMEVAAEAAGQPQVQARLFGTDAERKRWLKRLYGYCPLYVRPVLAFLCRYVLMGGFLDGYPGWYWHTRQGLRYRWRVDSELCKIRRSERQ